jgi:signal transduction histidine kinase
LGDLADQLGLLVHSAALVRDLRRAHEDLILAREEERRRLRRDLHDGLGPALAGLTLKVEAARNLVKVDAEAAESVLQDLRGGIQATVLDVRRVVQGLRPPALDELGLAGAVAQLATRLGRDSATCIEVDLPGPLPPLTAAVEVAAYRVTQEALTNAVRHAPGAPCRVVIRGEPHGLCIEVVDAGDGRVAAQPQGAGLATMRERAEEIGGELTIVGDPGRGTTVRLRLPLRADVAAPIEQGAAP